MSKEFITVNGAQVDPAELERQGWTAPKKKRKTRKAYYTAGRAINWATLEGSLVNTGQVRVAPLAGQYLYVPGDGVEYFDAVRTGHKALFDVLTGVLDSHPDVVVTEWED